MKQNTTLKQQLADLKKEQSKEYDKKVRELTIKDQFKRLTGLSFSVCVHNWKKSESISIWIENDRFNNENAFSRFKIKEYYEAICKEFTPQNTALTFASKEPLETFAPAKLSFDNNVSEIVFDHPPTVNIHFTFKGDITVSFKMSVNRHNKIFSNDILGENVFELTETGRTRKPKKQIYYLDMFGKCRYYGHQYVNYCESPEDLEEFMSVIFFGHTPQFVEGFVKGNIS